MIWLTWRQFRVQALVATGIVAALAVYLVILGRQIRHAYDTEVACGTGCSAAAGREILDNRYSTVLMLVGFVLLLVPALLGAFWGAPLIAREVETGTYRLVWNQSVTRTRWLAVKLTLVTLTGIALTGALSALFTWAASPYDKLFDSRFDPLLFPTRNIAPLGYAAFAVAAGITIGLLTRRTVPAMAIVLAVFTVLQIVMPTLVRPHLQSPVTAKVPFSGVGAHDILSNGDGNVVMPGYTIPGAWVLTSNPLLLDATGNPTSIEVIKNCHPDGNTAEARDASLVCLESKQLHLSLTYQPAGRYWTFQWLEFTTYLALAALLSGFAFWRIRRSLS